MARVDFSELPDHGRLWVFPASRDLADDEVRALLEEVDAHLDDWAAHGKPLRSAREIHRDRFLLVGVDEDAEAPSGCSIDALVNRLRAIGERRSVTLIEHTPVWFLEGDRVRMLSRADFRTLARDGAVGPDDIVFDTTLTRVEAVRQGRLELPARESWHGRAFFQELLAG